MDQPATPAIHHSPEPFVPESRWPRAIGTISIVYGAFGIIFMVLTLLGIFLGPWLQASLGGMKPVAVPPVLLIGQTCLVLCGLVLGIILVPILVIRVCSSVVYQWGLGC